MQLGVGERTRIGLQVHLMAGEKKHLVLEESISADWGSQGLSQTYNHVIANSRQVRDNWDAMAFKLVSRTDARQH